MTTRTTRLESVLSILLATDDISHLECVAIIAAVEWIATEEECPAGYGDCWFRIAKALVSEDRGA